MVGLIHRILRIPIMIWNEIVSIFAIVYVFIIRSRTQKFVARQPQDEKMRVVQKMEIGWYREYQLWLEEREYIIWLEEREYNTGLKVYNNDKFKIVSIRDGFENLEGTSIPEILNKIDREYESTKEFHVLLDSFKRELIYWREQR